jgi:hypothetical protein
MSLHRSTADLEAGLARILAAPRDRGSLQLIVRRPVMDRREVLESGRLTIAEGLAGDSWRARLDPRTGDGVPQPDTQLNIVSARCIALLSPDPADRPLAGDQLYLDLDLSQENLPVGSRLAIGEAIVEVTAKPHRGCAKFSARFGVDALRFVNSPVGRDLRLRGLNARVVTEGTISCGDAVLKL